MAEKHGFPYEPIEFTKKGEVFDNDQREAVEALAASDTTDLFVISHGWRNDRGDADSLYGKLLKSMRDVLDGQDAPQIGGRKFGVVGVFWPSMRYTDPGEMAGGGASAGGDEDDNILAAELDALAADLDPDKQAEIEKAKALLDKLEDDEDDARIRFVEHVRAALEPPGADADDSDRTFFDTGAKEVFNELQDEDADQVGNPEDQGGAAGLGDFIGDVAGAVARGAKRLFSGVKNGARKVVNYATYYQMKSRAGTVGVGGLATVLDAMQAKGGTVFRVHLIGHSFGARVVTAAADAAQSCKPASISLLQAAFSHNAFAVDFDGSQDGDFHQVVSDRLSGPLIVTHTKNDNAVGVAYPIASRLMRQNASGMGDANDPYGALGSNGAQHMKNKGKFVDMLPVGGDYAFNAGVVYNLHASEFIPDHGTIYREPVAYAVLNAAASTG